MNKTLLLALCLTHQYLFSYCPPVHAQASAVTFTDVLKIALSSSPEAAQIDATISERSAEAFSTRTRHNPLFNAQAGVPSGGSKSKTELSLTISQEIRPSDFGARTALARLIEETSGIERTLALHEFVQTLRILYSRSWQAQERERILREASARAQEFLKKIEEGAQRGAFSEGDVELFKAELKIFESDRIAAQGESAAATSELTRQAGCDLSGRPLQRIHDAPLISRDDLQRLVENSKLPLQQRYRLLSSLAAKQLDVARLDSFPAIAPQVGYGRTSEGTEQLLVGFSVPLPFFDRNQGERIRAQGALAAAERGMRYATSQSMTTEALLLLDSALRISRQVELYSSGIVPAKKRALEAFYKQFEAGLGSTFQLWQAQRELNDARLRHVELQTMLSTTTAQINALTGTQDF